MSEENAGVPPVEKAPVVETPEATQEPTAAELLVAAEEEIARLEQNNANLTRGIKKAKGKLPDDDEDDDPDVETAEERTRRIIREELANTELARAQQNKDALIKKVLKENEELRNLAKNKPGTGTNASGGGADKDHAPQTHVYWSNEQLADLKSKGLDPEVVYRNMQSAGAPGIMPANPIPEKK